MKHTHVVQMEILLKSTYNGTWLAKKEKIKLSKPMLFVAQTRGV